MVNHFSVDQVDLYLNWTNTSLFIILGKLPTLNLPPFIKVAIFSDEILVLNYHGCKEEATNLIPHYLIDIIQKTVKPSHLEKLQITQNSIKSITRSFIILNTMMENENTSFANISISFLRYSIYAVNMISGKGLKYQQNLCFHFPS